MSKLIYYTFNNMYCILAFYVRFIKACINPRKKAETSKQICKTDQYLGYSGRPVSAVSWQRRVDWSMDIKQTLTAFLLLQQLGQLSAWNVSTAAAEAENVTEAGTGAARASR